MSFGYDSAPCQETLLCYFIAKTKILCTEINWCIRLIISYGVTMDLFIYEDIQNACKPRKSFDLCEYVHSVARIRFINFIADREALL